MNIDRRWRIDIDYDYEQTVINDGMKFGAYSL